MARQSKTSTREIREQQQHFAGLIDGAPDPIIILNHAGSVMIVNPALENYTGYNPEEILGRLLTHSSLISRTSVSTVLKELDLLLVGEKRPPFEMEVLRKDGEKITFEVNARVIRGDDETDAIQLILRDVTERKRLDQLKDEFVSTVSHELRTPLSIVTAALDNLHEGVLGPLNEKQAKVVATATRNSSRLAKLIDALLDLSRLQSGLKVLNRRPLEIPSILADILEGFQLQASAKEIKIETEFPADLPRVNADGDRLAQVFNNLIANALRHTQDRITIRAEISHEKGKNHCLKVSVSDNGHGLAAEAKRHIFNKFQQFHRGEGGKGYQGTGLGLAICKEIIHQHGGRIWVEGDAGEGARFYFTLPLVEEK